MIKVYCAGAYSADNVMDVLANMRRGLQMSLDVLEAGYAPFSPWLDFQFGLCAQERHGITIDKLKAYSMAWLEVSDCVLVCIKSENSSGTAAEIARAKELDIPVFYNFLDMDRRMKDV